MNEVGKSIIIIGLILALTGIIILFRDSFPWIKKIGNLPGDLRFEKENVKIYIPLMTSLLLSILLSVLLYLFKK